jgi:hypothetical protein
MNDQKVNIKLVVSETLRGLRRGFLWLFISTVLTSGIMYGRGKQMPWVGIGQMLITWPFLIAEIFILLLSIFIGYANVRYIERHGGTKL